VRLAAEVEKEKAKPAAFLARGCEYNFFISGFINTNT
jgi:hypothetical protein